MEQLNKCGSTNSHNLHQVTLRRHSIDEDYENIYKGGRLLFRQ